MAHDMRSGVFGSMIGHAICRKWRRWRRALSARTSSQSGSASQNLFERVKVAIIHLGQIERMPVRRAAGMLHFRPFAELLGASALQQENQQRVAVFDHGANMLFALIDWLLCSLD